MISIKKGILAMQASNQTDKFIFLDDDSYVIDNVRIYGSSLWYDCIGKINPNTYGDFTNILYKSNKITPEIMAELHYHAVSKLQENIVRAIKNGQKLLIATHIAPLINTLSHPKFKDDQYNVCFGADMSEYLSDKLVHTWVYGHTHYNTDMKICGTRIVSNQRGNFPVSGSYKPNFCIEV